MGLQDVENDILRRGEQEAKAVLLQGQKEADAILADAKQKAEAARRQANAATESLLAALERRELAAAEFDMRKAILDTKKDAISTAIERAKDELAAMPAKQREEYVTALIALARKEIDVAMVYANPKDKKAVAATEGISYKENSISGGIIAETADGKIRVDYQYDELLREIREHELQELGKILF